MKLDTVRTCTECGTPFREGEDLCRRCDQLPDRVEGAAPLVPALSVRERARPASFPVEQPSSPRGPAPTFGVEEQRILGLRAPWFYLLLGFVVAPVFSLTPLLGLIGWYLAALVHEMGHCLAGWLVGRPAYPVLGLNGHAMSVGEGFSLFIAVGVWAVALTSVWFFLRGSRRWIAGGAIVVAYPVLVFTPLAEMLSIMGGHLGEMAFAGIFLYRAITGGFTSSAIERGLYAVLGWYLVGVNLWLTGGLMFSEAARRHYGANGSYGLTNDYLVAAHQLLGTSVEGVAALMTLPALAVVPVTIAVTLLLGKDREDR